VICLLCHRSFEAPEARCPDDGSALVSAPAIVQRAPRDTASMGAVVAGRYAIKGLVGRGGFACVYLAEDTTTGAEVAVKILHPELARNPKVRDRFLREVQIAAQLGHPNIPRILDAGEGPDRAPFLVLEYLHGEPLGAILARSARVGEELAIAVVKRAASALAAAHAGGVIHRDVKPDNLFLANDGTVVKVLDFGMAKLVEGVFTAAGVAVGTIMYVAPEQAMGDRIDGRADVYALGITLFRLLVGRVPFAVKGDAAILAHHLYVPMPRPSELCPDIDPRIERVILAATRKRPGSRYPTMRAMLEDLGRIAGDRGGALVAPAAALDAEAYEPENPIAQAAAARLRTVLK
jgi:serine/threonine-protein kinase